MKALVNGASASEWVLSRGLHFGDGIFRTALIWQGQVLDWSAHIQKLESDCRVIGLQPPDQHQLHTEAQLLAADCSVAVLKLLIVRQATGRGYRADTEAVDRILLVQNAPTFPEHYWTQGIAACRSPVKLSSQPLLAGIKHLNRLEQVLASSGWSAGVDEAILADQQDHPVCGTRTNLFWVKNGHLHTPALEQCGVAGVMRRKILDQAAALGIRTEIRETTWTEIHHADEVFVCNALLGIWPLSRLDDAIWPPSKAVTPALQNKLRHPKLSL